VKILLVVSRPPFPPRRGDQMRAVQALEFLGAAHEVTLLAPSGGGTPPSTRPGLRIETHEAPGSLAKVLGVARALFSGQPLQSGLFRSGDLARKLRTLAPRHDLVLLQLERLIGHLPDLGSAPLVVDLIDSLALNVERRADFDSWPARPALRIEAARLLKAERRLAERAAKVLVVSERDRRYLKEHLGPELAAKVKVVPLAMSIPEELPPTLKLWKKPGAAAGEEIDERSFEVAGDAERPLLAITGNLGYFPTVDGALWFLAQVWPAVRAARPEVRLAFVGARPSPRLRGAIARAGAELIESPPDLRAILFRATLALAPMRAGSGLPVKILEAWAAGVPVLATPWAAAGVSGRAGEDFAVAEPDPAAWCREILRLIDDPAERRRLAENARKRLAADYGAENVAAGWRAAVAG
jgi:polysaccharide biosynthesis protein PslH